MSNPGDARGIGTEPPAWWLRRFHEEHDRRVAANAEARSERKEQPYLVTTPALGRRLAEIIGRSSAWNHSAVSNFLNGVRYTVEMAEAFSIEYGIPRFEKHVRAETEDAANDLEMFLRKLATLNQRVPVVDEEAARLTQEAKALTKAPTKAPTKASPRSRKYKSV